MPRREKVGKVVSSKMDKTIVVLLTDRKPHPKYGKFQTKSTKYKAHDENNVCKEGDIVRIVESRPYSKEKTWCLKEVVQQTQEV